MKPGVLVAFEGLDQSGKQTQAEALVRYFTDAGQPVPAAVVSRTTPRRSAPRSAAACRASATTVPT